MTVIAFARNLFFGGRYLNLDDWIARFLRRA